MQKGDFDFNDFLLQTQSVRKMGGMSSMLKMIPGRLCNYCMDSTLLCIVCIFPFLSLYLHCIINASYFSSIFFFFVFFVKGVAGKINEEQLFEAEKRMKRSEVIIGAMSEEERADPDLIVRQGGKKELVREALVRRENLAQKTGLNIKEVSSRFLLLTAVLCYPLFLCKYSHESSASTIP
jgi:hypothetical protein